jgi:hypothetical protein
VHVVQQNGATTLHRQAIDGGSPPPVADEEREAPGTRQTSMTHIAIQEFLDGTKVEWMERISDEQYRR